MITKNEIQSSFIAPKGTQGITRPEGANFYFTSSHGFGDPSDLVQTNRNRPTTTVVRSDLSPMSQGLDAHDGLLVTTNESAAPDPSN